MIIDSQLHRIFSEGNEPVKSYLQ